MSDNSYVSLQEKFGTMTPDEVLQHVRTAIDTNVDEQRKIHGMTAPSIVIDFFKLKNITQTTAFQNGLMLYMYLILWKEQNPHQFNLLEEFFISYVQNHQVILKRNDPPLPKNLKSS